MKYFGITQQTANWLLERKQLRNLIKDLLSDPNRLAQLKVGEIVEGPLRMTGTGDELLIATWNVDYLSGTGEESWGFIRLAVPNGIFANPSITPEVFERCLYVINQRLQALLIDGAYIHRPQAGGVHTCLAGRGDEARQYSIAFKEVTSDRIGSPKMSPRAVRLGQMKM